MRRMAASTVLVNCWPADRLGQHREGLGQLACRPGSSSAADNRMHGKRDLNCLTRRSVSRPGEPRHVHVQQQQMHLLAAHDVQRLFAVAGQQRAKPRLEDARSVSRKS